MDALVPFLVTGRQIDRVLRNAAKLKTLDVAGGTPKTICDAPAGNGGTWGSGGVILFAPNSNGPIYRVSANGGEPAPVTELDAARNEYGHRWPQFLPDGKHFFFQSSSARGNKKASIRIGALDTKETRLLTAAASTGHVFPPGLCPLRRCSRNALRNHSMPIVSRRRARPYRSPRMSGWMRSEVPRASRSRAMVPGLSDERRNGASDVVRPSADKKGELSGEWGENWAPASHPTARGWLSRCAGGAGRGLDRRAITGCRNARGGG